MFNFQRGRLNEEDALGEGAFGIVYPYKENGEDLDWAVKHIEVRGFDELLKCFTEIMIGSSCDHPCVLPIKGYFIERVGEQRDRYNVFLRLPRMKMDLLAELRERTSQRNPYTEIELVKYFYCLASGTQYLHNKRIFYIDIKPNNILLDNKGNVKLCDFGTAKFISEEELDNLLTESHGTYKYKAPELIRHERLFQEYSRNRDPDQLNGLLNHKNLHLLDSWSLGLTMLELCSPQQRQFDPSWPIKKIQIVLDDFREWIERQNLHRVPLFNLIFGLLNTDPTARLSVSEVKSRLEEEFPEILTMEYRATLGLLNEEGRIQTGTEAEINVSRREYETRIADLIQDNTQIMDRFYNETEVVQN